MPVKTIIAIALVLFIIGGFVFLQIRKRNKDR
jgi:hypothetical protein